MSLLEIYQAIKTYFDSDVWQLKTLPLIKVFSAIFSIFLFVLTIILMKKSDALWKVKMARESLKAYKFPKKIAQKWQKILKRLRKGDESNLKLAVIEADKLFDNLLLRMGYSGQDMDERLKLMTSAQLSNLEEIWQAHKIRDRVVGEKYYRLSAEEAEKAISAFEKAFKELMIL